MNIPPINYYYVGLIVVAVALILVSPQISSWLILIALFLVLLAYLSWQNEKKIEKIMKDKELQEKQAEEERRRKHELELEEKKRAKEQMKEELKIKHELEREERKKGRESISLEQKARKSIERGVMGGLEKGIKKGIGKLFD